MVFGLFNKAKPAEAPPKKEEVKWDPWANTDVDELKIKKLIRVRINFIMKAESRKVDPNFPDLSGLLSSIAKTTEQRAEMERLWREEATLANDPAQKAALGY